MTYPLIQRTRTYVQWLRFSRTGSLEGVREDIKASWLRCREKGLNPTNHASAGKATLPAEQDGGARGHLKQLVTSRYHDIESRFSISPFAILFAGPDGRLLSMYGSDKVLDHFAGLSINEGATADENFAGTNAPGLALIEKKPVMVSAEEHFFQDFHWAKCFAVPLFDHRKRLAGALGLTTTVEYQASIETLIEYFCWLANSLPLELFIEEKLRRFELQDSFFRSTFEQADQALVLVNPHGDILDLNLAGQRLLGFSQPRTFVRNLHAWIQLPQPDHSLASRAGKTESVHFRSLESPHRRLAMETIPLTGHAGDPMAYLLRFSLEKPRPPLCSRSGPRGGYTFDSIVARSPRSRELLNLAKRAARTSSSILLEGETGTGKELLAQAIHSASPYRTGSFVAVNCAAIPQELVESELFGYEPGSYTGAKKEGSAGKFELANGGTIFLDEIQSMTDTAQMKLLRILEERAVTRIGGLSPIPLDFRVIAASSVHLRHLVDTGDFLEALFYRLNVVNFDLPALRDRKEDISALLDAFIREMNIKFRCGIKGVAHDAMDLFMRYAWPGNVRELRNCIEYAFNFCDGEIITVEDLGNKIKEFDKAQTKKEKSIEKTTRNLITEALKTHHTVDKAADALGISTSTLYRKMKRFGLSK